MKGFFMDSTVSVRVYGMEGGEMCRRSFSDEELSMRFH